MQCYKTKHNILLVTCKSKSHQSYLDLPRYLGTSYLVTKVNLKKNRVRQWQYNQEPTHTVKITLNHVKCAMWAIPIGKYPQWQRIAKAMIKFGKIEFQKYLTAPKLDYLAINANAHKFKFSPKMFFYTFTTKHNQARLNKCNEEERVLYEVMFNIYKGITNNYVQRSSDQEFTTLCIWMLERLHDISWARDKTVELKQPTTIYYQKKLSTKGPEPLTLVQCQFTAINENIHAWTSMYTTIPHRNKQCDKMTQSNNQRRNIEQNDFMSNKTGQWNLRGSTDKHEK